MALTAEKRLLCGQCQALLSMWYNQVAYCSTAVATLSSVKFAPVQKQIPGQPDEAFLAPKNPSVYAVSPAVEVPGQDGATSLYYASPQMLQQYFAETDHITQEATELSFRDVYAPYHQAMQRVLTRRGYINAAWFYKDPRWKREYKPLGRGTGTGTGKFCGLGNKRRDPWTRRAAHVKISPFFEWHREVWQWNNWRKWWRTPFFKLVPKRVFKWEQCEYHVLTLDDLRRAIEMKQIRHDRPINVQALRLSQIIPKNVLDGVYVTKGSIPTFPFPITLIVNYISREAKQQVLQGGGTAHSAYLNQLGLKAAVEPQWFETDGRFEDPRKFLPHSWTHSKYDDAADIRADVATLRRPLPGGGYTGGGGTVRLQKRADSIDEADEEDD